MNGRESGVEDYLGFLQSLHSLGEPHFLEGGQAVNFWAEYIDARTRSVPLGALRPFTSKDCDIWVDHRAWEKLKRSSGKKLTTGNSPADGQLGLLTLSEDPPRVVDLMSNVYGIPVGECPRLYQRALKHEGVLVIDPLSLFQSKCHCLLHLDQTDRQDERHLRMLALILPEYFSGLIDDVLKGTATDGGNFGLETDEPGDGNSQARLPSAACSSPTESKRSLFRGGKADLVVFLNNKAGDTVLHFSRYAKSVDSFEYTFDAPKAGTYQLVADLATPRPNQKLYATANGGAAVEMALPELIHNNLRCMWYGMFTKEMADAFVDHHLLNPESFWTPVPLPSISIHEPLFHNGRGNNWSGQPQGLTYQRAIDALENYGRFAEVTRLGQTLLPVLIRNDCKFAQQLDPHTGAPYGPRPDGYGPMMLAALEYITRMHGIHIAVADSRVWWSAVDATDFTATQRWGEQEWRMESKDGSVNALVAGKPVFTVTAGARVVTDLAGRPLQIVGISPEARKVTLAFGASPREFTIQPNEIIAIDPVKP